MSGKWGLLYYLRDVELVVFRFYFLVGICCYFIILGVSVVLIIIFMEMEEVLVVIVRMF